ncbi:hypothetical protein BpHYR1_043424 [Brachionus plicatilis]|uniref:Uncharacterized protein n=1 Tax=Brachionus plicatilis TaxID=10195 RepID=A0A3M7QAF1_BRAPC|nr:hypothetical protein BpHYR1_043424 [Brachionus plicatilis]
MALSNKSPFAIVSIKDPIGNTYKKKKKSPLNDYFNLLHGIYKSTILTVEMTLYQEDGKFWIIFHTVNVYQVFNEFERKIGNVKENQLSIGIAHLRLYKGRK